MTTDIFFKRTGSDDFPKHLKCMISGPPKSGKTTLLGTMPGIIVLDTEPHANNLESIAHLDVPYRAIESTDDLRQALFMLKDDTLRRGVAAQFGWPDVNGVAIDTLDSLQQLMKKERMKEQRTTQFLRDDWGWLKAEMESIIQAFTELPMHVVFIVHTKTKDMGRGDDSFTVTLPGLEGSIADSVAGMVGYSMLSFRKEDVMPDGTIKTNYYLRTEGDATHDYLGTRTAGRLPTVIEPNLKTIYDAVMASRPAKQEVAPSPGPEAVVEAPVEEVAQIEGQNETSGQTSAETSYLTAYKMSPVPASDVQTDVETSVSGVSTPETPEVAPVEVAPAAAETPIYAQVAAERPTGDEPVNMAALGHVKKVYDAIGSTFPEETLREKMTIGQARELVMFWRAAQQDEAEGNLAKGRTAIMEMVEYLAMNGWGAEAKPEAKEETEPSLDGTIAQVMKWVGEDIGRAQEAYDVELAKGSDARQSLIKKLEAVGAKPEAVTPVTPSETPADAGSTEEKAVATVEAVLGGQVVSQELSASALCEVCGQQIDDLDLAKVGVKRFEKILCVKDYLAEQRK